MKNGSMMISTGIKYLDKITGGLKLGDNVVWQISSAVPVDYFIKSFFRQSRSPQNKAIYVNFNFSPQTIIKKYGYFFKNRNSVLIDAFTHGKGNSDPVFLEFYSSDDHGISSLCLGDPRDRTGFMKVMNEVEMKNTEGSFYVFDSLTGMMELWKDETAVLDFFTFTCPKLYDLNTLAYWTFEKEAHSREFIAGLTHITQVVIALNTTGTNLYELKINKLDGREAHHDPHTNYFKVVDDSILFREPGREENFKIGEKIKEQRKLKSITQADLAKSLAMTPGAVSQLENDITAPSLGTLVHLAELFDKPLDYFISGKTGARKNFSFFMSKKTLHSQMEEGKIEVFRLIDESEKSVSPYAVTMKGKTSHDGPILLHKGSEFIAVIKGKLVIVFEGQEKELRKGDSCLLRCSFIEKWENPDGGECEFIYFLL